MVNKIKFGQCAFDTNYIAAVIVVVFLYLRIALKASDGSTQYVVESQSKNNRKCDAIQWMVSMRSNGFEVFDKSSNFNVIMNSNS